MSLLDRYVLKQFLLAYAVVVIVIMALFTILDLPNRLKQATKDDEAVCGRELEPGTRECPRCTAEVPEGATRCPRPTQVEFIVIHYASTLPLLFIQLSPFLAVLAGALSIALLQQYNELIPMRAAGISPVRIVAPLFVAAAALGGLSWLLQEQLLPNLQALVQRVGIVGKSRMQLPKPIADGDGGVLFVDAYDTEGRSLHGVIYQRLDEDGRELYEVVAPRADWLAEDPEAPDEAGRWALRGGLKVTPTPEGAASEPLAELPTQVLPRDIFEASQSLQALSSAELQAQAERLPQDAQRMAVLLESRFAYPFAGLVLLLLGLPFVLDEGGNPWLGSLLTVVICALYYVVTFILLDLAKVDILPARLAAWLPNLLFVPFGVWLMVKKAR